MFLTDSSNRSWQRNRMRSFATDHRGIITLWNPRADRIFGFTSDEIIGRSLDLINPHGLRARHWTIPPCSCRQASHYGQVHLLSVPALTKSARRISIEFTIVMLKDKQDRPMGTVAILRDVTRRFGELRALKRQLAARASIDAPA